MIERGETDSGREMVIDRGETDRQTVEERW